MSEYAVQINNLVKHYNKGKVHAVNGLTLNIKKGEIYAFIGANGSGKSTTINILTGVLFPTSGSIRVMDMELPKERKKVSRYIGYAPQEYSIYEDLTVYENLEFFARMYGISKKTMQERIIVLLRNLKLYEKRDSLAGELSGGMKRRVSIASALIHNPPLVLFDEATVGVDPVLRAYFWDYFRSLRDQGHTLLITTHVMDEAEKADRIGLIRGGVLFAEGTPDELKKQYNAKNIEEIFLQLFGDDFIDE